VVRTQPTLKLQLYHNSATIYISMLDNLCICARVPYSRVAATSDSRTVRGIRSEVGVVYMDTALEVRTIGWSSVQ
jgi:hypothetical protein